MLVAGLGLIERGAIRVHKVPNMEKKGNTKDKLETLQKKKRKGQERQNNKQPSGRKRPQNVRTEVELGMQRNPASRW